MLFTNVTSRPQQFLLDIVTSAGPRQLPMTHAYLTLESRESRIILSDFRFGMSSVLHTSTAVLFGGVIDGRDVLFLHRDHPFDDHWNIWSPSHHVEWLAHYRRPPCPCFWRAQCSIGDEKRSGWLRTTHPGPLEVP